jgi:alpha-1,2-mannosyltransferase
VVVALAALVFWYLGATAQGHGFFDLKVYYGAVRYWAGGHGEIYDFLKPTTKYGFTYPPFAALVMLPIAPLPWNVVVTLSWLSAGAIAVALLHWLLGPVIRRHGWPRLFTLTVALLLIVGFEPFHETVSFGQVNMVLVFLVMADYLVAIRTGRHLGGIGIGLATAIKLTPGIFIVYLLLARRYRAAAVASVTAAGATVLAMVMAPDASREYWTEALWDTDRVGQLSYISNQSWEGFVARFNPGQPNMVLWAALVLATLMFWAWRVRRAVRAGDELTGLALTGVLGALISPVTWVHHLVWLLPAMLLLAGAAVRAHGRRRIGLTVFAVLLYALLASEIEWHFADHFTGWGVLGSNALVYASVALLIGLPVRAVAAGGDGPARADGRVGDDGQVDGVADLGEIDGVGVGALRTPQGAAVRGGVEGEAVPLVEPARPEIVREHP